MNTFIEFIESTLESAPNGVALHAAPQTLSKVNDKYTATFKWTTEGDATKEDIPVYEHSTLPLTANKEYSVIPNFIYEDRFTQDQLGWAETADFMLASGRYPTVEEPPLDRLTKRFSEVNLSQEQFIDRVEGDDSLATLVDMVSVTNHCSNSPLLNQMLSQTFEDDDGNTLPGNGGFHFLVLLKTTDPTQAGGLNPVDRLAHVSTIELGGYEYPVTFDITDPVEGKPNAGQPIYTSDALVEHANTDKICLADRIEQIDWREFFASDQPHPQRKYKSVVDN